MLQKQKDLEFKDEDVQGEEIHEQVNMSFEKQLERSLKAEEQQQVFDGVNEGQPEGYNNDEDFATQIRNSVNKEARQSERDEVESHYSDLNESMQQNNRQKPIHSQLIAIPNALCSVCETEKDSCIILTNLCRH